MSHDGHAHPDGEPDEAAAYWDARLRSPDCSASDRAAYEAWRAAAPANAEAFERLQDYISALRASGSRPMMRALRDAALRRRQRVVRWAALAAACVLALGGAGLMSGVLTAPHVINGSAYPVRVYSTPIGERATYTLEDGSQVTLNTASRLETHFSPGRRDVRLVAGQGLFDVAHDASRPFVVAAADRQVTAIGTQFDVRVDRNRVRVVLVEGRVSVARRPDAGSLLLPRERRELVAGQEYDTDAPPAEAVQITDINQDTMWRQGRVSFVDTPLPQAVAEMNRYSSHALIVDPSMNELRINGVFRTSEPDAFVNALQQYFPVDAERQAGGDTLLVWRDRRD